ncbi:MAG: hypothetical protein QW385_00590 [Thermoproteota archaeon]
MNAYAEYSLDSRLQNLSYEIDSLRKSVDSLRNVVTGIQQSQGELWKRVLDMESLLDKTYTTINKLSTSMERWFRSISDDFEKVKTDQARFHQLYTQKLEESRKDISERIGDVGAELFQQISEQTDKLDENREKLIEQMKEIGGNVVIKLRKVLDEYEVTLKDVRTKVEVIVPKIDEMKKPVFDELRSITDSLNDIKQAIGINVSILENHIRELKEIASSLYPYNKSLSNEEKVLLEEYFERLLSNLLAVEKDLNNIVSLIAVEGVK